MTACRKYRVWTPDERKKQSATLHHSKIWLKSTGSRTAEGKARSSMNARKADYHLRLELKQIRHYLRLQKLFTDTLRHRMKYGDSMPAYFCFLLDMRINFLENELDVLEMEWLKIGSYSDNIIPFSGAPPSS